MRERFKKLVTYKTSGHIDSLFYSLLILVTIALAFFLVIRVYMIQVTRNQIDDALTNALLAAALWDEQEYGKTNQVVIHNLIDPKDLGEDVAEMYGSSPEDFDLSGYVNGIIARDEYGVQMVVGNPNLSRPVVEEPNSIDDFYVYEPEDFRGKVYGWDEGRQLCWKTYEDTNDESKWYVPHGMETLQNAWKQNDKTSLERSLNAFYRELANNLGGDYFKDGTDDCLASKVAVREFRLYNRYNWTAVLPPVRPVEPSSSSRSNSEYRETYEFDKISGKVVVVPPVLQDYEYYDELKEFWQKPVGITEFIYKNPHWGKLPSAGPDGVVPQLENQQLNDVADRTLGSVNGGLMYSISKPASGTFYSIEDIKNNGPIYATDIENSRARFPITESALYADLYVNIHAIPYGLANMFAQDADVTVHLERLIAIETTDIGKQTEPSEITTDVIPSEVSSYKGFGEEKDEIEAGSEEEDGIKIDNSLPSEDGAEESGDTGDSESGDSGGNDSDSSGSDSGRNDSSNSSESGNTGGSDENSNSDSSDSSDSESESSDDSSNSSESDSEDKGTVESDSQS